MEIVTRKNHLVQVLMRRNGRPVTMSLFDSGDSNPDTTFRYFRLTVDAITSGTCLQFSHIEFINRHDEIFDYFKNGATVEAELTRGSGMIPSEPIKNGVAMIGDSSRSTCKVCFNPMIYPTVITYDLGSPRLNVGKYSRWRWRYSNDTASETGRNMKTFSMSVSNDKTEWLTLDSRQNMTYALPYTDGKIAYTGDLVIPAG